MNIMNVFRRSSRCLFCENVSFLASLASSCPSVASVATYVLLLVLWCFMADAFDPAVLFCVARGSCALHPEVTTQNCRT